MASIERRVGALEATGRSGPFARLTDVELEAEINGLCVKAGTTLQKELETYGSFEAFGSALNKQIAARTDSARNVPERSHATH